MSAGSFHGAENYGEYDENSEDQNVFASFFGRYGRGCVARHVGQDPAVEGWMDLSDVSSCSLFSRFLVCSFFHVKPA